MSQTDDDALLRKRVYDMVGCVSNVCNVKVFLNNEIIGIKNFRNCIWMNEKRYFLKKVERVELIKRVSTVNNKVNELVIKFFNTVNSEVNELVIKFFKKLDHPNILYAKISRRFRFIQKIDNSFFLL
jgi:hypothetical protein